MGHGSVRQSVLYPKGVMNVMIEALLAIIPTLGVVSKHQSTESPKLVDLPPLDLVPKLRRWCMGECAIAIQAAAHLFGDETRFSMRSLRFLQLGTLFLIFFCLYSMFRLLFEQFWSNSQIVLLIPFSCMGFISQEALGMVI